MDYKISLLKNKRYMLLEKENRFFLVDGDTHWILSCTLALRYLCYFKAFEISREEASKIEFHDRKDLKSAILVIAISTLTTIVLKYAPYYVVDGVGFIIFSLFFIMIFFLCIVARFTWRKKTDISSEYCLPLRTALKIRLKFKKGISLVSLTFSFILTIALMSFVAIPIINSIDKMLTLSDFVYITLFCMYFFGAYMSFLPKNNYCDVFIVEDV